jgi:hypothetical protein
MPAKSPPRERPLILMLLSACDDGAWSTAVPDWIEERVDGAVEVIARRGDGATLAIEHTLVQPFVNEKLDSAAFMEAFGRIDRNPALVLPEQHLEVILPVHAIPNGYRWADVGADLLAWLTANHTAAPTEGAAHHKVPVCCGSKKGPLELEITLQTMHIPGNPGGCFIARKDMPKDLGTVVEKALRTKVTKLANTSATKRILLLEKEQVPFSVLQIYAEIVRLASSFPDLAAIHELWFVDTSCWATEGWAWFSLLDGRGLVELLTFEHGALNARRDDRAELGPAWRQF